MLTNHPCVCVVPVFLGMLIVFVYSYVKYTQSYTLCSCVSDDITTINAIMLLIQFTPLDRH